MFASRIANSVRVVLPYAAWAGYAIQLGYVGYNLYQYYEYYRSQVERDQQNGRERSLNDTIELVIRSRRRRRIQEHDQLPSNENQASEQDNYRPSDESVASHNEQNLTSKRDDTERSANVSSDADVTCVFDSRTAAGNAEPSSSGEAHEASQDEDALSNASTSLESTDSSRGIIHDIHSQCFICARSLNDPKKPVATLPFCLHPFHKTCLDGVLKWHPKCPVCDFHIFSPI